MILRAWEFCTNGYPDPDAWVAYLKLITSNAWAGVRHGYPSGSAIGRGYSRLINDAQSELKTMGVADEL
jgi:hypothetical protein